MTLPYLLLPSSMVLLIDLSLSTVAFRPWFSLRLSSSLHTSKSISHSTAHSIGTIVCYIDDSVQAINCAAWLRPYCSTMEPFSPPVLVAMS